jgi:hypothetical protein
MVPRCGGSTYKQGRIGEDRGSKETDGCPLTYVPKDRDLRRHIVEQHHDTCVAGHAGRFKTLKLISCNYWWPQMS